MSVIYAGDLSHAMNGAAVSSLNADKEDAASMINAIQDFISNTTGNLVGRGYDEIRGHLQSYIGILEARSRIADEIIAGIKSACGTMISYMDGEGKLDTSELPDYYNKLNSLLQTLANIAGAINSYDPDESDVSLSYLYSQYTSCELQIKEVKRMIDLLEGLDAADAGAFASYSNNDQSVSSLNGSVAGVSTINVKF